MTSSILTRKSRFHLFEGNFSGIPPILAKLRGKSHENILSETEIIIDDLQKLPTNQSFLDQVKMINFKHVAIMLNLFLMSQLSGINVLTSYLVDIFSSLEIPEFTLVLVTGLSEIIFSFLQMVISDKLGR